MAAHSLDEQQVFLRRCFQCADGGLLNVYDLKCGVAAALGIRASKLLLAQLFSSHVEQAGGDVSVIQVDQDSFMTALLPRMQKTDLLEHVRRCFKAMDMRSEGFISLASFQAACAHVLPHLPPSRTFHFFREADRNHDGRVTYNDFETIYLLSTQLTHQLHGPHPREPTAKLYARRHHR